MRLSEAILLGLPKIEFTNEIWSERRNGEICRGCLVGAALKAVGSKEALALSTEQLHDEWPWTKTLSAPSCPCKVHAGYQCGFPWGFGDSSFTSFLTHLASHYGKKEMSAEQIADIIRSIEPEEPCEQTAEQESVQVERVTR